MGQAGASEPRLQRDNGQGETNTTRWEYLGVGCFSTFVGFAGGGMIAVLVAKAAGALVRCPTEAETGAPCNWLTYAVFGALIGAVVVPSVSIWFFRRGRIRARHNERG
jgi:hypothetical protein